MKVLLRIILPLFVLCIAGVVFLVSTEPGLQLLVKFSKPLSFGKVSIGSGSGALIRDWKLNDVEVETSAAHLQVGELTSKWQAGDILSKKLHIAELQADDIDVYLQETKESDEPEKIELPKVVLPFSLLIEHFQMENLRLFAENGSQLTVIDSLSFSLDGGNGDFRMSDFVIISTTCRAGFSGALNSPGDWHVQFLGNFSCLQSEYGSYAGDIALEGPLARLHGVIDMQQPAPARIEANIINILQEASWQAEVTVSELDPSTLQQQWPELQLGATGRFRGDLNRYEGSLKSEIVHPEFGEINIQTDIKANVAGIEVDNLQLDSAHGGARLPHGSLSWRNGLHWQAELILDQLDPAIIQPELSGTISAELTGTGSYNNAQITGEADIRDVFGTLQGMSLAGSGKVQVDENGVRLDAIEVISGSSLARLSGWAKTPKGLAAWDEAMSWNAGIKLLRFNPGIFFPDYPGDVTADLTTHGALSDTGLLGQADIESLSGELRGYAVSGDGVLRLDGDSVILDKIHLQSGNSALHIDGAVGNELAVTFSVISEQLGEVLQGAEGSLALQGNISGSRELPHVEAALKIDNLNYEQLVIAELDGRFKGGVEATSDVQVEFSGKQLSYQDTGIENLDLDVHGTARSHQLSIDLQQGEGSLSAKAQGKLKDDFSWSGIVENILYISGVYGGWQQDGSAQVEISDTQVDIKTLCFVENSENICLSGHFVPEKNSWQTKVDWDSLDLSRIHSMQMSPEPVWGTSSGSLSASGDLNQLEAASGRLKVTGGGFGRDDAVWEQLLLETAELDVEFGSQLLSTQLTALFADKSTFNLQAEVPGFGSFNQDLGTLPLQGSVQLDLRNLAFVAPLTYYTVVPAGSLQGTLVLSGLLTRPTAEGALVLEDGSIDLPTWGISLKDATFQLTGSEGMLDIEGVATSGPGQLTAQGYLTYDTEGVIGDFYFTGADVDTFLLPEYEIRTNPNLRIRFNRNGGSLTGSLEVPHAVLTPEEMSGSLSPSDDVVFVDGSEEEKDLGWFLTTSLQVELGEDVRLDGYGIQGFLSGDLLVESKPGSYMTGKGELSLSKGTFSIYGRTLDIVRGKVMFGGGPIDNPGIDVMAQKIVADKGAGLDGVEVGVIAGGTVDDLEFKLFSYPDLDESDILAYMVVGRSMSDTGKQEENLLTSVAEALGLQESAELVESLTSLLPVDDLYFEGSTSGDDMSLVFGKRLTSDLYIGYDHNFLDQKGEVLLRYDLGSGFSAESRTSADGTSADLLYSFEK